MFRLLALGDIVGEKTVKALSRRLWGIRSSLGADMVIANGENASSGNGLSVDDAEMLLAGGVDVITSGNHIFKKSEIYSYLDSTESVLRPANYPSEAPGVGFTLFNAGSARVLAVNLIGTVYMESMASPFDTLAKILKQNEGEYDISAVDFHAEATSEKMALAYDFAGRVGAVFGTHTHVATSDERILPGGTAYVTDLGMCGPEDGILGVRAEEVIKKFKTKMPVRFAPAEGNPVLHGVLITFDGSSAVKIERLSTNL